MNLDWLTCEWIIANKEWLFSGIVLLAIGIAFLETSDNNDTPSFKDEQNKHLFFKEYSRLIFGTVAGTSLLFLFEIGEPPLSCARLVSLYCFIASLFAGAILFLTTTVATTVREETTYAFHIKMACKNKFEKYLLQFYRVLFVLTIAVCFPVGILAWLWDFSPFTFKLSICLFMVGVFYYSFVLKITNRFKKEYQQTKL